MPERAWEREWGHLRGGCWERPSGKMTFDPRLEGGEGADGEEPPPAVRRPEMKGYMSVCLAELRRLVWLDDRTQGGQ